MDKQAQGPNPGYNTDDTVATAKMGRVQQRARHRKGLNCVLYTWKKRKGGTCFVSRSVFWTLAFLAARAFSASSCTVGFILDAGFRALTPLAAFPASGRVARG